jgi:hypothetical protein
VIVNRSPFEQLLTGPDADVNLRTYYEGMRSAMASEQSSWRPQWEQLARFNLPRNQRFNYSEVDRGDRKDYSIVDNTGTLALRTLGAGMMAGMSSPSREWFKVKTSNDSLNDLPEVQDYLEEGADQLRATFMHSNFYQTLHNSYKELGLYGTQAFCILEDPTEDIRCYPWPLGSYYIAGDAALRTDLFVRIVNMTARQLVDTYGKDQCSSQVQTYYSSNAGGQKEQWFPVVQVVHPNTYYGRMANKYQPWVSVHYEMNNYSPKMKLLRRGGFQECPVICSRWEVTGENFYGNSPGMECLGDVMGLQLLQKRKSAAIDKMVNPPMIASPAMANTKMSLLPGDVTYGDMKDGSMGFKPAFEMKFDITAALKDIEDHKKRIKDAYYESLFLMISGSDRREVTAEEIRAKQEEKMLVLGPVLERSNGELFTPAIRRTWAILRRRGKIGPPPDVMRGHNALFEFESILAQAQRMLKIAAIDRFHAFVGGQAAVNPNAYDIIDSDTMNREYGDDLAVPGKILRDDKTMDAIRQQRAKQQQAAEMAANAQKLAPAAQVLSNTDASGDSALNRMLGTIGQGGNP